MRIRYLPLIVALAPALPAGAQSPEARSTPGGDIAYESVFKSYKPYEEPELGSWKDLNDEVAKAGGHVGIFGGAGHAGHGAPASPPQQKPAPTAPSQPPMRGSGGQHDAH